MPMYDYRCTDEECGHVEESIEDSETIVITCSECGGESHRFFGEAPKIFNTIVPDYPGSKKFKAGYIHTHGDKPKTKVQGRGFSS